MVRLAAFAPLAALLLAGPAVAQPPPADSPPIVVEGEALARSEIERILAADNVDTSRLSSAEVVATIRAIRRGRAPEDFWTAYQAHVAAWERFADSEARAAALGRDVVSGDVLVKLERAAAAIETTFDEVERIAQRYGARLPAPPVDIGRTI